MQCPFCNGFRPANNAPCPSCNAPSPLANDAWNSQNASFPGSQNQAAWGGSGVQQASWGNSGVQNWGGSGVQQNDWSGSNAGQMAFPSSQPNFGGSGVQQVDFLPQSTDNGSDNSFWSQNMATRDARSAGKQQSLLPVPFQGGQAGANGFLPTAFPTLSPGIQPVNSLVPALPDGSQEAPVYVAPMYTKPRPIIPRYRAISGLISVIVILSLLCGGSIYYAQVTGKLTVFEKLFGNYSPPAVTTNQQRLAVPSNQIIQGPASNVVYSVGISNKIDRTTGIVPVEVNQFTTGETIWLACSANPPKDGTITIQWYSDGHRYQSSSAPVHAKKLTIYVVPIVYGLPTEGKAEVYWNDQLAATVLFVVEPTAA